MDSRKEKGARRDILLQNMANQEDPASIDATIITMRMATTEQRLR